MASYNFFFNTFPTQSTASQTAAENISKRNSADVIDLTEEDDVDNSRAESKAPPTADSQKRKFENPVNSGAPFAQSDHSYSLDDHRPRKKKKAGEAHSAYMNSSPVQAQLPFKCKACQQSFKSIMDLINHHASHKRQQQHPAQMNSSPVQEQLPFKCETCQRPFESLMKLVDHYDEHWHQQQHPLPFSHNPDPHPPSIKPLPQQRPVRCRKCHSTFLSTAQRDHHYQTSPRHFCCRYCPHVVAFDNTDSLHCHYVDRHNDMYCHFCREHLATPVQRDLHMASGHVRCSTCLYVLPASSLRNGRCQPCYSEAFDQKSPTTENPNSKKEKLSDHYATLGISAVSSHEDILKAAKEMRVKMHPDRRKRVEGLSAQELATIDAEAAAVGQAADVLSDAELRAKYDAKLRGGKGG